MKKWTAIIIFFSGLIILVVASELFRSKEMAGADPKTEEFRECLSLTAMKQVPVQQTRRGSHFVNEAEFIRSNSKCVFSADDSSWLRLVEGNKYLVRGEIYKSGRCEIFEVNKACP